MGALAVHDVAAGPVGLRELALLPNCSEVAGALLPPLAACAALRDLHVCFSHYGYVEELQAEFETVSADVARAQVSTLTALTTLKSVNIGLGDVHDTAVQQIVLPALRESDVE